jgi:hypothetical protein
VPAWAWALLAGLLLVCLAIDLVAHRGDHVDSRRTSPERNASRGSKSCADGSSIASDDPRRAGRTLDDRAVEPVLVADRLELRE